MKMKSTLTGIAALAFGATAMSTPALAAVTEESQYIFNSLLFLIGGFLVMWMAAGFTMLEVGLVRTKNVGTMCVKNIGLYSIAGLMYFMPEPPVIFWLPGLLRAVPGSCLSFPAGFASRR